MKFKSSCVSKSNNTKITCEEHKRKIIFINPKCCEVLKITVDDCQITEGPRCDFLVICNSSEHFVELKGGDIRHAFKQLKATIRKLGNSSCQARHCYVIANRCPLISSEIQIYKHKFMKHYASTLIVKNNKYEVYL